MLSRCLGLLDTNHYLLNLKDNYITCAKRVIRLAFQYMQVSNIAKAVRAKNLVIWARYLDLVEVKVKTWVRLKMISWQDFLNIGMVAARQVPFEDTCNFLAILALVTHNLALIFVSFSAHVEFSSKKKMNERFMPWVWLW